MSEFDNFVAITEVTNFATCDCCRGSSVSQTVFLVTREDAKRLSEAGLASPDKEGYKVSVRGIDTWPPPYVEEWFLSDTFDSEGCPEGFADIRVREISTGRGLPEREITMADLEAAAEAACD